MTMLHVCWEIVIKFLIEDMLCTYQITHNRQKCYSKNAWLKAFNFRSVLLKGMALIRLEFKFNST